jgi:hypothetical protein
LARRRVTAGSDALQGNAKTSAFTDASHMHADTATCEIACTLIDRALESTLSGDDARVDAGAFLMPRGSRRERR